MISLGFSWCRWHERSHKIKKMGSYRSRTQPLPRHSKYHLTIDWGCFPKRGDRWYLREEGKERRGKVARVIVKVCEFCCYLFDYSQPDCCFNAQLSCSPPYLYSSLSFSALSHPPTIYPASPSKPVPKTDPTPTRN